MFELNSIYYPITALPDAQNNSYIEVPPCNALRPYVRCFWGTSQPIRNCEKQGRPVIPDTCMDIIFETNYSKNEYVGSFLALDEGSYNAVIIDNTDTVSTFAIRFYAWSAVLFSDNSMKNSKNLYFDADEFFHGLQKEFEPFLCSKTSFSQKIKAAEQILMNRINLNKFSDNLMNGLYHIIKNNGNVKISDICDYTGLSKKTLERVFNENMGITPKSIQSLIRYQLLWQDIYSHKHFDVFDAVLKYGYFDQAHLLNDFKRRHSMTPNAALMLALG
ncbi:MAG: AraC family transcriptional regulator [Oscillospiraceae bacterium]|nr:AraC family transcriptional regulator [Oscillospiraceae bacterium]